jgi:hypothetical protein
MDFTRAETVHEAWLSSESHRANIENPNYKEIGIAVVHGKLNGKSTTVLVEFFGTTFIPSIAGEPDVLYSETAGNPLSTEVLADGNNPQLKSAEVTAELKGIENKGFLSSLSSYSDKIYWALFLLLISALMVNIFVKIRIQHQPAIIQTIAVLLLIGSAIAVRTHFLENIPRLLQII